MKCEWGNSSNSKGNPIDLKTGHPFKCYINLLTVTQRNTLADSVPNQKEGEVTLCTYNKGNEEEGDNYTNLAEMASDYDVYLTKELGGDKKGPSPIGKTFNVALLYTVSMRESLV